MATNYIQAGNVLTVLAPAAKAAGAGVLVGDVFGVAQAAAASGAAVEIMTTGVHELAKTAGTAWAVGDVVYWLDSAEEAGVTRVNSRRIGVATEVAASAATVGRVRLDGEIGPLEVQELTASGAVTPGAQSIELNHATVVVAATLDLTGVHGLIMVKDTSASGTAAHTLTVSNGTINGTATVMTLNAPNEAVAFYVDSAGNGTVIENVGTVVLS